MSFWLIDDIERGRIQVLDLGDGMIDVFQLPDRSGNVSRAAAIQLAVRV